MVSVNAKARVFISNTSVKDFVHRVLASAHVPSRLISIIQLVSTQDGITKVPWREGKLLVWDTSRIDTFTPSYSHECYTPERLEQLHH